MHLKSILRLYTGTKILKHAKRFYTNRNILLLHERGMLQDLFPSICSSVVKERLIKSPQCVYSGFDPTADCLHVGNLLVLMNLLHWQRAGHQVIVLLGGATGQIGDPSHRLKEREGINNLILEKNVESIKENVETIFSNHEKYFWKKDDTLKPVIFLNNNDWYKNLNIIEFTKGIGKYFRLGTMMGRSSVQSRLNSDGGMSFTEFSYQVFQAYDWLYLMKKYNCYFQVGGHDQMGNIMSGHDFINKITQQDVYGLTVPLITTEGGKKFGKSSNNAIWLSAFRSSFFSFYQFFIRTPDSEVDKLLKFFTFLSSAEIMTIMEKHRDAPEKREAQKILAEHVTRLVHGNQGLCAAEAASLVLYDDSTEPLSKLSADEAIQIFDGANIVELPPEPGMTAYELAMKINCFKSDNDALRIIPAGGFYINHSKITNVHEVITPGIHILANNLSLVRVGKKTYHVVKWIM